MNTETTIFEKISNLIKNSITLKLVTITILMLLLLIPASMIQSLITEREALRQEVTAEVSSKWANGQQINGPILTIPVIYEIDREDETVRTTKYWHVLPETLNVDGNLTPETLNRGIYEVVVYKSDINLKGDFAMEYKPDPTNLVSVLYDQAFLTVGITDLRGIKNQVELNWNGQPLKVQPGSRIPDLISAGITVDLPNLDGSSGDNMPFDFTLELQGSKNISFVPVGASTNVGIRSSWQSPSFNGSFLPDTRQLDDQGFSASWSVLQLNRNYPQQWVGNGQQQHLSGSAFGVDLIIPVDDYQKSDRSAKYAVMTIALTFLVFFLVEILNKKKIHPFQYALVGLALCLFYTLLVSISEHTNFNFAYWISTSAVVAMISLYSISVFKKIKFSLILVATLIGIYGFLFVTLQLTDYALLLGSIGLTVILGLTMYYTRKINWYRLNIEM